MIRAAFRTTAAVIVASHCSVLSTPSRGQLDLVVRPRRKFTSRRSRMRSLACMLTHIPCGPCRSHSRY